MFAGQDPRALRTGSEIQERVSVEAMEMHPLAATGFADVADSYERGRPEYPAGVVDVLGLDAGARVLDLAAGTGKLTRVLRAAGLDVVPVEPLPAMRARIPGALDGTAEAIPLEDASVDGATIGDAWHWFDHARAGAELARVVRPGGPAAILWQGPSGEEMPPWAQSVRDVLMRIRPEHPGHAMTGPPDLGAGFSAVEHHAVPFAYTTDRQGYLAFVASMSWIASLPEGERAALLEEVGALVPDEASLPYATQVFIGRRLA